MISPIKQIFNVGPNFLNSCSCRRLSHPYTVCCDNFPYSASRLISHTAIDVTYASRI